MGKKATYKPTDGKVNGASYRALMSRDAVQTVVIRFSRLGDVQLSKATLATLYDVYEHVMLLCEGSRRGRAAKQHLEAIEDMHVSSLDDWCYILNTVLDAGVELPIVQESEVGRD